ncbi:cytochrome-c oxidase, cbb3-type subunit II [Asticcacaulis sp. DW145]|uniref:Cytochrome-c oxidase, cbb3-type subunit II n=1 Tax=Asticcacaulis currens TaxID=2984210 RepID=A0ABT5IFX6_9CAUL|nr:cytochrome-c oxidase, cbb3-type subunit II [Asticcacaulis currens]MDC7695075.1 cytochrome-c oxidase, cbb3-type subunit II [Asticcacaulis currens]BEV12798.1 cytochrome-c oxidase, cbb3-type subunit II [Asticcacaulis sp. DW145]
MLEKHKKLERNSMLLLMFTVIAVSIGGIIEILPLFRMQTTIEPVKGVRPYTPLELMGQEIYIREGCNTCHSQQIRPLRDEQQRYGHYSLAAESMYDHPFVWGSKRTGPDLARVGGKYSDEWHVAHLKNPRAVVPESIMPSYAFLAEKPYGDWRIKKRLKVLQSLGVPYTQAMIDEAQNDYEAQANPNTIIDPSGLQERYGDKVAVRDFDGNPDEITEMDALIAYLQKLGTDVDFSTYDPDYALKPQDGKPKTGAAK